MSAELQPISTTSTDPDPREHSRGTHVAVTSLSLAMRQALKAVRYGARDIEIRPTRNVSLESGAAWKGARGFVMAVNLTSGERVAHHGSWGGGSYFESRPVDTTKDRLELPENGAVLKGQTGYPRTMATLYVHPSQLAAFLPPASEDLTAEDQQALYVFAAYKGGQYRRDELNRRRVSSATVRSLIERGYLTENKAGAVSITLKGKNARNAGGVRY